MTSHAYSSARGLVPNALIPEWERMVERYRQSCGKYLKNHQEFVHYTILADLVCQGYRLSAPSQPMWSYPEINLEELGIL